MSRLLSRLLGDERGVSMMIVVFALVILSTISVTLLELVGHETTRSSASVRSQSSFQAAEAGIDDYLAKLIEDHLYYVHEVHPGEATRRVTTPGPAFGDEKSAGSSWPNGHGLKWDYPHGKNAWRSLSNGYEYNLQIAPPSASTPAVRIVATGRKAGATTTGDSRVIETLVQQSSLADYFRVVNDSVSWGDTATTYGKLYSVRNITHDGTAHGNIYAEGSISGSTTMENGAQKYDSTTIRTQIKEPIRFNDFLTSFSDIKRASQIPGKGVYLDNSAPDGWKLTFQNDGTMLVYRCTRNGGNLETNNPTCTAAAPSPRPLPPNGAIYAEKTTIVSGAVKGRVTVASNDDIIVGDNITYVDNPPGEDVLGLVAIDMVFAASWVPAILNWRAAVLAQTGTWRGAGASSGHDTMNFTGGAATNDGGGWGMFRNRNYFYDDTLLFLEPPWFPRVGDVYKILVFRELPSTYQM